MLKHALSFFTHKLKILIALFFISCA